MGGTPHKNHIPFPYCIVSMCKGTPQLTINDTGPYGNNLCTSQKWTYLHSLGYALFTPCLVYVSHKFKRCGAGQLCALGRGWILKVNHIPRARLDRLDDIQLRESSLRRVRHACIVENSTQVIPRGRIVRRKRNLLPDKAIKGMTWMDGIRGHRHGGRAKLCQQPTLVHGRLGA